MHEAFVPAGTSPGMISNDPNDIKTVFLEAFSSLYKADTLFDIDILADKIQELGGSAPRTRPRIWRGPTRRNHVHEVHAVVQNMKTGSAPGPEELPTEFYETFWPVLGDTLASVFNGILTPKRIPSSFKPGRLVLLHKVGKDPRIPTAYRPILVLNTDYKIFASLLVSRIKNIWPELICPQQTSSVPDRNIFSTLSLTRDLFAYTNHTMFSGMVVSLDQESAFDRVAHPYLYATFQAYGFPPAFAEVVRALHKGITSDSTINGQIQGKISQTRGQTGLSPLPLFFCVRPVDPPH